MLFSIYFVIHIDPSMQEYAKESLEVEMSCQISCQSCCNVEIYGLMITAFWLRIRYAVMNNAKQ